MFKMIMEGVAFALLMLILAALLGAFGDAILTEAMVKGAL